MTEKRVQRVPIKIKWSDWMCVLIVLVYTQRKVLHKSYQKRTLAVNQSLITLDFIPGARVPRIFLGLVVGDWGNFGGEGVAISEIHHQ